MRDEDILFVSYRDHVHALLRGTDPGAVMAELYGKRTGVCKGKGGSMHLFDVSKGLYGGYDEMDRDPNVVLLGEDVGVYGGTFRITDGLLVKYGPGRVIDTPISELGFIGCGIGMAMLGSRPVIEAPRECHGRPVP